MKTIKSTMCALSCGVAFVFAPLQSVQGVPVTLSGFSGYGYNTIDGFGNGYDGQPGAIGCGPTSGAMVLNWYTSQGPAPGLIGNPLTDARTMWSSAYMDVDLGGFGKSWDFQIGLEQFALDRGYKIDAVIHVEPTTYNPANWSNYSPAPVDPDLALDATFWADTTTWDINKTALLDFIRPEIDTGNPVVMTVDSNGDGNTDHWMVGIGYDLAAQQWAGYNTWDNQLHWYDVQSAFKAGNTMGIGFVRTFEFLGPVGGGGGGGGGNGVPDAGSSLLMLAGGLLALQMLKARLHARHSY